MILATKHGNRELRFAEWGNSSDIPRPGSGWLSASGWPVRLEEAYGLPAVSNVIRSPAEIIASLPFIVYEKGDERERAENSWQWQLLHESPSPECDTFQFFYDLALSLEATQNAFVQKAKFQGRVYAMYVLDPQTVSVERDRESGDKKYRVWTKDGYVEPDPASILHIRGFTPKSGGVAGVSLIQMHRDAIGAAIAMQKFEGDYFRNNATAPFWVTGAQNSEQAKEMRDAIREHHGGPGNQWKPGVLWGQADIKQIPMSMEDALFADAKRLSIEDACRIWRWPREFVELGSNQGNSPTPTGEGGVERLLKFSLLPRLRRIERAFAADPDLFPTSGSGSGRFQGQSRLFGEFLTAALERADFVNRVRGYKDARQGSWITANEIRKMENLPPAEGGDTILITPTGSAPNPPTEPPPEQDETEDDERGRNGRRDVELAALLEE